MADLEAGELRKRVLSGLASQRAAEARERALIEAAREQIQPLPGEARQFFKSHINRLIGAESALGQGDASEKQLLGVRLGNMSAGLRPYQEMQARALGIVRSGGARDRGVEP